MLPFPSAASHWLSFHTQCVFFFTDPPVFYVRRYKSRLAHTRVLERFPVKLWLTSEVFFLILLLVIGGCKKTQLC